MGEKIQLDRGRLLRSIVIGLCGIALLLTFRVERLPAQAVKGTLVGTVSDRTGAAVPNADVVITKGATNVSRGAKTGIIVVSFRQERFLLHVFASKQIQFENY